MTLAILIAVVALLLIGFLLLTVAEAKSGKRALGGARGALDNVASGTSRMMGRVDPVTFLVQTAVRAGNYAVHHVIHGACHGTCAHACCSFASPEACGEGDNIRSSYRID